MTGRIVECPIDEVNRPRGRQQARLRIPPSAEQVGRLFAGWRDELATCRKFAPAARNYTAWILTQDEAGFRPAPGPVAPARLLPSGDAYLLRHGPDRDLLVPDARHRRALWTPRVWPGGLLMPERSPGHGGARAR